MSKHVNTKLAAWYMANHKNNKQGNTMVILGEWSFMSRKKRKGWLQGLSIFHVW